MPFIPDPTLQQLASSSPVQGQLSTLIQIVGWLAVPVGVLLVLVLYKLLMLLQATLEFVSLARYEVYPLLKELRHTAAHLENLSGKVANSADAVSKVVNLGKGAALTTVSGISEYLTQQGGWAAAAQNGLKAVGLQALGLAYSVAKKFKQS